jgi:hypothetical protein
LPKEWNREHVVVLPRTTVIAIDPLIIVSGIAVVIQGGRGDESEVAYFGNSRFRPFLFSSHYNLRSKRIGNRCYETAVPD